MYHDGNTASNTLTPPTPRGSITPVTMAKAFHPIEKTLPVSPGAQSTQVSHTQALKPTTRLTSCRGIYCKETNAGQDSRTAYGSI